MNYTYAFSIIGCRVYITDDEYAKNRFKYLAQRCPAVFLRFEHSAYENLVENFFERDRIFIKKVANRLFQNRLSRKFSFVFI